VTFEIGLFEDTLHAEAAIERLHQAGFTNDDISILSKEDLTVADKAAIYDSQTRDIGGLVGGVGGFFLGAFVGAAVLAIPGIGLAIATGVIGTVLATMVGGAAGAAAGTVAGVKLIPALMDSLGIAEDDANLFAEAIRRNGILLAVKVDPANQAQVAEIMRASQAVNMKERQQQFELQGWHRFQE
jgi:hypothetical protein